MKKTKEYLRDELYSKMYGLLSATEDTIEQSDSDCFSRSKSFRLILSHPITSLMGGSSASLESTLAILTWMMYCTSNGTINWQGKMMYCTLTCMGLYHCIIVCMEARHELTMFSLLYPFGTA